MKNDPLQFYKKLVEFTGCHTDVRELLPKVEKKI